MAANPEMWLLTADLGFGVLDAIRKDYPERAVNMGASEMLMTGAAIGLAESGKIAITYSITPFVIYRPFESESLSDDESSAALRLHLCIRFLRGVCTHKTHSHTYSSSHVRRPRAHPCQARGLRP